MSGVYALLVDLNLLNSKEVLLSVPEADRRQSINKKELLKSDLGNERALGVL